MPCVFRLLSFARIRFVRRIRVLHLAYSSQTAVCRILSLPLLVPSPRRRPPAGHGTPAVPGGEARLCRGEAWCLVPGAWCLVPGAWSLSVACCLVPGAWCLFPVFCLSSPDGRIGFVWQFSVLCGPGSRPLTTGTCFAVPGPGSRPLATVSRCARRALRTYFARSRMRAQTLSQNRIPAGKPPRPRGIKISENPHSPGRNVRIRARKGFRMVPRSSVRGLE